MLKETKLWHDNRCIGTIVLDKDHTASDIVVEVLNLIFTKQDNYTITIIVNDLSVGGRIVDKLTDIDSKYRELIKKCNIRIITPNMPLYDAQLTILVCPKTITDCIRLVLEHSRFKLVICDKLITDVNVTKDLYKVCPLLNYVVKNETKSKKYSSPPVEEEVIGINIDPSSPTGIKLDKCDRYIEESINIFGDFPTMDKARRGDVEHNISAQDVCNQIAEVNGWTQSLDMSFPYNVQIDAMYNPNNLNERANQTYDVIRTRTELLSTFPDKLEKVYELVTNNKDSNILIINKTSDFAHAIAEYINNKSQSFVCGEYHPNLETINAIDVDGNPVYYKSGLHSGEPKKMAAKAQMTLANQLFNLGRIKALSANNAPNKDLSCQIDCMIITSPLCETIEDYMNRLSKVTFNPNGVKLYTLFINDSIEEKRLNKRMLGKGHIIVNKREKTAKYDENDDVVIVD